MKLLRISARGGLAGIRFCISLVAACMLFLAGANAATATYAEPAFLDGPSLAALSTAGDNAGASVGFGETLSLVFDQPFGVRRGQNVSIFTLPPDTGRAWFTISFGVYNNGSPTIAYTRNRRRAGRRLSINNLFQRGCSAFGGCDYIEISLTRRRRGATSAEVDYVSIDGEVTQVTSPTPEPSTWALMIFSFWMVGWRLKKMRRCGPRRPDFRPGKAGWRYAPIEMTPQ